MTQELTSAKTPLSYVCPYTSNTLSKPCIIESCPAFTLKHETRCAHVFFKKPELNPIDIAYIKDISEPKAKRLIDEGERKIQRAVLFYRFLSDARIFFPKLKKSCACGLKRVCLVSEFNTGVCPRKTRNEDILKRFPWKIPILGVTPPDIYSIFRMREKLQNSLKRFFPSNDNRVGLQAFLELSREEYDALVKDLNDADVQVQAKLKAFLAKNAEPAKQPPGTKSINANRQAQIQRDKRRRKKLRKQEAKKQRRQEQLRKR